MIHAATAFLARHILVAGIASVVVVAIAGVAIVQYSRSPDLSVLPVMAARPVILADGRQIFVQAREVTVDEWNRCANAGACDLRLRAPGAVAEADWPATGISWVDATQYLAWMNETTGHDFRLPSLSEWQTMAAAVLPEAPAPLFTDPDLTWAATYLTEGQGERRLRPSGSYSVSPEGVADLDGNVWEWTQDCYRGVGEAPPSDARCPAFHVGGEHDAIIPYLVRDPARGGCASGSPPAHLGMRLVADEPLPRVTSDQER
jgi:formylglycine-generating enzyme required for sulfatase activity